MINGTVLVISADKLEAAVTELLECTQSSRIEGTRTEWRPDRDDIRAALIGAVSTLCQGRPVMVDNTGS